MTTCCGIQAGTTFAIVNIVADDSVTLADAFQFGVTGDTWSFAGQNFKMDVKGSADDTSVLMSLTSLNGYIVVVDSDERILQFNVPSSVLSGNLPPATYTYSLIMFDNSTPSIEVGLMQGTITITHGVTQT